MAKRAYLLWCLAIVLASINLAECNRRLLNRMLRELRNMNRTLCDKIEGANDNIRALEQKHEFPTCPVLCQPDCQPEEMCINLNDNVAPTGSIPGVSLYSPLTSLIDDKPCSRQIVLKVHFLKQQGIGLNFKPDPCIPDNQFQTTLPQQRLLKIQMYLSSGERSGWVFNVGDSKTNDGYGGDQNHQTFNAEVQGLAQPSSKSIHVYGHDLCNESELIDNHFNHLNYPVSLANLWIRDNYLKVSNDHGLLQNNCNRCLFALNGQDDTQGLENEDIYVAANRVIYHGIYDNRTGVGLCYMKLRWVNSPFQ